MVEEKKIPPGYKKTEVGVIPEEWEIRRLGDMGVTYGGLSGKSKGDFENGNKSYIPFLNVINNTVIDINYIEHVKIGTSERQNKVERGDLCFNSSSETPEDVGMCAVLLNNTDDIYLNSFCFGYRLHEYSQCVPLFLAYYIRSDYGRRSFYSLAQGATRYNLSKRYFKNIVVPVPTTGEQTAIVKILSDIDNLINSIEDLIEKKQKIKQGAMQELLTGKKRLPGFSGAWETRKIEEMAKIVNGGTPSTLKKEYWGGEINFCTPTDITSCSNKYLFKTEKTITPEGLDNCSATLLPEGTLLLCSRATIGEVRIAGTVIATNQGFKSLVCENLVYNEFLYYYIQQLKGLFISMASGSTFLEISKKDLANIDIFLPPLAEQQAIAQILSDMDSEIETLEEKLKKYRALKQGMMQELLTGRIRLL